MVRGTVSRRLQRRGAHQRGLLEAIHSKPEIEEMAVNPVMLTALAVLHWNDKRLPDQRSELYDSVLKWLARSREDRPGARRRSGVWTCCGTWRT